MLLLGGLAACGRTSEWIDPRTGALLARGALDLVGRPHGEWTWWYENGEIREHGSFVHGHRQGRFVQWYPGGQRHSEGERRFDPEARASPREGPWSFWYSNGRLRGSGSFRGGKPDGEWSWWDHQGLRDERRSGTYRDGQRVE